MTTPTTAIEQQPGPLARSVADVALVYRLLNGPDSGGPTAGPGAVGGPLDPAAVRVGFYVDDGYFPAAPGIRRVVREAADALRAAGTPVSEFRVPQPAEGCRLFLAILGSDGGAWLRNGLRDEKPEPQVAGLLKAGAIPGWLHPVGAMGLRLMGQRWLATAMASTGKRSPAAFEALLADLAAYQRTFGEAMDRAGVDVLLSPPHALPALRHGASELLNVTNAASYAVLYNTLGLPAGVVAAGRVRPGEESDRAVGRDPVDRAAFANERESAGLPVGVQVAARKWREDQVLGVMGALEAWFRTTADYPADSPV